VTGHTPEGKPTVLYDSSMPLLEAGSAAGARQEDRARAVAPRPQPHHASQGAAAADTRIFQRIGAADTPAVLSVWGAITRVRSCSAEFSRDHQAALWYSLISPLTVVRRLIRAVMSMASLGSCIGG
jgi:hypothetical protein